MERAKKPCVVCGHGKSKHRKRSCNAVWVGVGKTFMGRRQITHYCFCTGYKEDK